MHGLRHLGGLLVAYTTRQPTPGGTWDPPRDIPPPFAGGCYSYPVLNRGLACIGLYVAAARCLAAVPMLAAIGWRAASSGVVNVINGLVIDQDVDKGAGWRPW
jgi:hypothetical protein